MGNDYGSEVRNTVFHQNAGWNRPARDHFSAGEQAIVPRACPAFPEFIAVFGAQAVDEAIVGAGVDTPVENRWCQANRSTGEHVPDFTARCSVNAPNPVIDG